MKELSEASGTIELGTLQPGTYKYALCIDEAPVSQTLTLSVREDGETANAAIPAATVGAGIYDLSGRAWKKPARQGFFIQNGKKMLK